MGKAIKNFSDDPNQDDVEVKVVRKKNLHKAKDHLEQIRQKALAAKREQMLKDQKGIVSQRSKSSLMKTLSEFSAQRQAVEDATQAHNILLRSETNSGPRNPKALNITGMFRAGVKTKLLNNCTNTSERRLVSAVLEDDAMKLLQSGNFMHRKPVNNAAMRSKIEKIPELANILRNSSESGDSVDGPFSTGQTIRSSPVFGAGRGSKKKSNLLDNLSNNVSPPIIPLHSKKTATKEERCKRKLFEDTRTNVNSRNAENDILRFSPTRSTPENVIYFAEHSHQNNVHNQSRHTSEDHEIDVANPKLIKSYLQTCEIFAEKEFKNLFDDSFPDPLKKIKGALKITYKKEFQTYVTNQNRASSKHNSKSIANSIASSNSEIMLEPDSQIARALKKNHAYKTEENTTFFSESTSDTSSDNSKELRNEIHQSQNFAKDNVIKRKRAPSSKGDRSEPDMSSTIGNGDPRSVRSELKMNSIHPDRQELFARYLKDVDTSNDRIPFLDSDNEVGETLSDSQSHIKHKEKLMISDNAKQLYYQKSTKHIPAILRKNRSSNEFVTKEKILLQFEKPAEVCKKKSMFEVEENHDLVRERTPNCENPQCNHSEIPKCKLAHKNAKYNQRARINIPVIQNKKVHKNKMPEKYIYAPLDNSQRNLVPSHSFGVSPVSQQSNNPGNMHDHHRHKFSQESSGSNNCMPRMVSFGDIQERTDRLTLRSSQNCSQGNSELAQDPLNLFHHFHVTKCEPSNRYGSYNNNNYPQRTCNGTSASQIVNEAPNHPHYSHNYNEDVYYNSQNDMHPPQNYYPRESDSMKNFSQTSNCETCVYQNSQHQEDYQHQLVEYAPQQQNVRQPVKFIAIEGNKRHPLYSANDASYAYVHKPSTSNHQKPKVVMPHFQRNIQNQAHHSRAPVQYRVPSAPPSLIGSDFDYKNSCDVNSIISSIPQGVRGNPMNFVPSTMSDQSYLMQQNVPSNASMSNSTYVGVPFQMQMISPLYSQHEYHPGHHVNNEAHAPNGGYLQQVDYSYHLKRL